MLLVKLWKIICFRFHCVSTVTWFYMFFVFMLIDLYFSGTIEDTELVDGLVFSQKTAGYGGPNKIEKAKIGLIQFCISPPKTDVST